MALFIDLENLRMYVSKLWGRRGVAEVALIACLGTACDRDAPADKWALEPSVTALVDRDPQSMVLQVVDSIGEGILSDGRGPIATSPSGLVAVLEYSECRVTVLSLLTRRLVYRAGRCGGGPNEFGAVGELVFNGDSLLVFDVARRNLAVISPSGEIVRRFVPAAFVVDSLAQVSSMSVVQESLLVSGNDVTRRHPEVGLLLRPGDGSVVHRFGRAQVAVVSPPPSALPLVRTIPLLCSVNRAQGPLIIASNSWKSETVAYALDGSVSWRAAPPVQWLAAADHQGRTWPTAVVRAPLCSDRAVMLRTASVLPWSPPDAGWKDGIIEIRAPDGALRFSSRVDSTQLELFSKGAAWRELWIFNDPESPSPRLRLFKLRPRTPADVGAIVTGHARSPAKEVRR